jgi:DNA-binding NtrC family response regulator
MSKKLTTIFIVDDNRIFRLALKADIEVAFAKKPIKIHLFETGENCMQEIKKEKPQLVILDYNLNSLVPNAADGIKILDWIKREHAETNVIMLTGDDHIDIALKSFHHGASDYVVKTETKFNKINYSLFNLIKMMEAKNETKMYKNLSVALSLCIGLMVGGIIAIEIVKPSLFR